MGSSGRMTRELTVPLSLTSRHWLSASQPRIRDISCTRALVSRAFVLAERRIESLARRHGWVEMCTFRGSVDGGTVAMLGGEMGCSMLVLTFDTHSGLISL